ncbi:MAG: leucine-rich repeat protein [Clostridia bacterium]|nr:leucine-rich repeat protein [Clostridia bacterium]
MLQTFIRRVLPILILTALLTVCASCRNTVLPVSPSSETEKSTETDTPTTPATTDDRPTGHTETPPDDPDGSAVNWCAHENVSAASDKKATCTTDGYKNRKKCRDCGAELDDTGTAIPAYGHEYKNLKCIHCGKNKPSLAASGQFENTGVLWQLFDDGELAVSGNGAIPSFPEFENGYFFPFNKAVKSIVVYSGVTVIGDNVFRGLKDVTTVSIAASVRKIGDHAFDGWSLKTLELPYGPVEIGRDNFMDNEMFFIELPSSVRSVGAGSFSSKQLVTLRIPASVRTYDAYENQYSNLRTVAFMGDEASAKKLALYDHLTRDGECATVFLRFKYTGKASALPYCSKRGRTDGDFTYAVFTDDTALVTAYKGASANVEIPEKLGSYPVFGIEHECFKNNKTIRSVTLPSTLNVIYYKAFVDSSVEELTVKGDKLRVGANAFSGCSSLRTLNFGGTFLDIGAGAFSGTYVDNIRPDPEMKIARISAFANAHADKVDFSQFEIICDSAFARSTVPESIDLSGVSEIGFGAFYSAGLRSVNVTNVKKIERSAFKSNSYLTTETVTGLDTVKELDEHAFDFRYVIPSSETADASPEE